VYGFGWLPGFLGWVVCMFEVCLCALVSIDHLVGLTGFSSLVCLV